MTICTHVYTIRVFYEPQRKGVSGLEYELSILMVSLLFIAGVISGFINTLAGGGSMLTLPAMMMLGMPADVANGTNRVGVLVQSLTGAKGFNDQDRLDRSAILPVLVPTILGALIGSLLASYMPVWVLEPVLLVSMVAVALIMVVRPDTVAPPEGTEPVRLQDNPAAGIPLFMAGVYGGFVQAGVGFILITALAGALRYDLVRTNALKTVCTGIFSAVALAVFALRGQVWWIPGFVLAFGSMLGAMGSVRFAINVSQNTLKWILFVMVTASCVGAILI